MIILVDVERDGGFMVETNSEGSVFRRTLSKSDMISSVEHVKEGTTWKKVEAIYLDTSTGTLKFVYEA